MMITGASRRRTEAGPDRRSIVDVPGLRILGGDQSQPSKPRPHFGNRQQGFVARSAAALLEARRRWITANALNGFNMNNTNNTLAVIEEMLAVAEPSVKHYARKLNRVDAMDYDDVCQELRIAVLGMIDRYDATKGASWKTFVNSQLHFRSVDLMREHGGYTRSGNRRAIETVSTQQATYDESLSMEGVYSIKPGAEFEWQEFKSTTAKESKSVQCLVLYAQGLLMHEIGEALGITESRVSQLMSAKAGYRADAVDRLKCLLGEVA
jgi:RNA polymerase sigma factor (sigma-70 family)